MKFLVALVLFSIQTSLWSADGEYKQILKGRLATQAQDVFHLYKIAAEKANRQQFSKFPLYDQFELNEFLQGFFGEYYDGYNELINDYVLFFTKQPVQHIRVWFGLFENRASLLERKSINAGGLISSLMLSQVYLLHSIGAKERTAPFGLSAPIALRYGLEINDFIDQRYVFEESHSVLQAYFNDLKPKFSNASLQLAAIVLGANTVNKARVKEPLLNNYWDLYPFLNHQERDFYPAMLAAAFVYSKRKECGLDGFDFQPKWETTDFEAPDTIHLNQVASVLKINQDELCFLNANYFMSIIPSGSKMSLPIHLKERYLELKDSIYHFSRSDYFPQSRDSCYVFYRTHRGDYFRDLTRWFGPQLNEIKELNGFKSNTLPKYWDVFFKVPCADSAEYAAFDSMSRSEKDAAAKGEPIPVETTQSRGGETNSVPNDSVGPTGKKTTYIVKSGDTLWGIGQRYKVSDTDIMRWNNIGTNIRPGQKLILYLP